MKEVECETNDQSLVQFFYSFGAEYNDGWNFNTGLGTAESAYVQPLTSPIIGFRASFATGEKTYDHPDYGERIELL